jgi:hypothetical protein
MNTNTDASFRDNQAAEIAPFENRLHPGRKRVQ